MKINEFRIQAVKVAKTLADTVEKAVEVLKKMGLDTETLKGVTAEDGFTFAIGEPEDFEAGTPQVIEHKGVTVTVAKMSKAYKDKKKKKKVEGEGGDQQVPEGDSGMTDPKQASMAGELQKDRASICLVFERGENGLIEPKRMSIEQYEVCYPSCGPGYPGMVIVDGDEPDGDEEDPTKFREMLVQVMEHLLGGSTSSEE